MHFKTQSDLNDTGKEIPYITQSNRNNLTQLQTSPMEVKSILETLQTGKASGPDKINNYVLKSCSSVLSYPLQHFLIHPSPQAKNLRHGKKPMSLQYLKRTTLLTVKIAGLSQCLVH